MSHRVLLLLVPALFALARASLAQATYRVNVDSNGNQAGDGTSSSRATLTHDGSQVAFISNATLVPGDDADLSVFVHEIPTGLTTKIDVATDGTPSNDWAFEAAISGDGRWVAFSSSGTNLVAGDTNGTVDVFLRDRVNGTTTRVSVSSTGAQANSYCRDATISADGRFVAFWSFATTLVPGDVPLTPDVFVHDTQTGTTVCASVAEGGGFSNNYSVLPALSADGRFIVFESLASNLISGDFNTVYDIYLRDLVFGVTVRVSVTAQGGETQEASVRPDISADGRFVSFYSQASDLVAGDTNGMSDAFVHDREPSVTIRSSTAAYGIQANGASSNIVTPHGISADGRFSAFTSQASNLVTDDTNGNSDAFVHDSQTGGTWRVSISGAGGQASGASYAEGISGDGRWIAFISNSNDLVPNDTNSGYDLFVRYLGPIVQGWEIFCSGDGTLATPCPCGNFGTPKKGCANSANALGARLIATGSALPHPQTGTDTLLLAASGMPQTATSIFLQGSASIDAGVVFGDGLRCAGGQLVRLAVKQNVAGNSQFPEAGDLSLSQKGGVVLGSGATHAYQTYYRDADLAFCPDPPGNSWNVTNGVRITW